VRLADVPTPVPDTGQVLLRTLCVGVDGTDREINEGVYGEPPEGSDFLVLGHEAVARVEKLGERVQRVEEGNLVVPMVRRPCWQNCLNCRAGKVDMCLTGDYIEHGILRLHGFASDYAVSDANFLVTVPDELKDVVVLLEPLSVAEKAIQQIFLVQQRMNWSPKRAFVLGAGSLGLLVTMLLRLRGLEVICSATRSKESLKASIVKAVGATYVNATESSISSFRGGFDLVVEATGNVTVAIDSMHLLGSNGVLCFLGVYREKRACEDFGNVLTNMVLGNRLMLGSVSSSRTHFEAGIRDMLAIRHRYGNVLEKLLTSKLQLRDYNKAFSLSKEEIKAVIYFR